MIRIGDHHRIGAVIADLRALNRLTQRQLGALVGVAQGQISDWERGEKIPTTAILSRIARGLGYELALMPAIETAPETALSASVADQGAETHTRVGVSDSSGAEARSGDASSLADLIIEVGPFAPGEELGGFGMALQRGTDLNELRNELIALRRIAAKAETLLRAADVTGTDQSPKEA